MSRELRRAPARLLRRRARPAGAARTDTSSAKLRAVIIVNPYSSGLTAQRERTIVQLLREYVELDIRRTERAGHGHELAADAVSGDIDLVIACGGDGTANEVLNGMNLGQQTAEHRPLFTVIPAGGTNVLCRSLGLPNDPVRATQQLATAIAARRSTTINLGKLDERIFMFAAGVGFDGQMIKRIEQKRKGRRPSDLSHMATVVGMFMKERFVFDERMTVTIDETGEQLRAGLLMCGNTSPMSYLGRMALDFTPDARLDAGLDFMAPRRVSALFAIRNSMQAMGVGGKLKIKPEHAQLRSNVSGFKVVCDEPQPCQADGEYLGDRTHVTFGVLEKTVRLVY